MAATRNLDRGRPGFLERLMACQSLAVATIALLAEDCLAAAFGADRRFVTDANPFLLGQASDWLDDRHVVWTTARSTRT